MKLYSVTLDELDSYITPTETGVSFESACDQILEYALESGYDIQHDIWTVIRSQGEEMYHTV